MEHEWIHVDILAGDTKTKEYLDKCPSGQIPLLELENGLLLSESNAILNYLAENSYLLPNDRYVHAKVLEWQFFEQYSHEPYIAVARYIARYLGLPDDRRAEYDAKQMGGHNALKVMEQQLSCTPYLVGKNMTIADISLYAYTHVANEGGFNLEIYPAIQEWIERIASTPNYIEMQ